MTPSRLPRPALVPALVLALAGLAALYAAALGSGFLNDDYLFLEEARHSPIGSLLHPGALANYFRPVSRQLWFALLTPIAGGQPLVWHLLHFAVFGLSAWLVFDLLLLAAPPAAALAGTLWFAMLPFQHVNLRWISGSQDLFALAGSLAALALFRRGRDGWAVLAGTVAMLSKETALPLPFVLGLWAWRVEGQPLRRVAARVWPFALPVLALFAGEWLTRVRSAGPARLQFHAGNLAAAFVHGVQSLLGLEQPDGMLAAFAEARPSLLAWALLAAAGVWVARGGRTHPGAAPSEPTASTVRPLVPARTATAFALAWIVAFMLPVWPVAYVWSGYYYTLAAAGAAWLVALAFRRVGPWGFATLAGALVWWNAAGAAVPIFAVREDPWSWVSHLTPWYFERAAGLSGRLGEALRRVEPHPAHGTRVFFATLPPYAGFQMGNGAAIRHLYRDDTIESHYYSAFSETTAATHPCIFLFWNGRDFERLYANAKDPMFQVGTDLLALDRPAGAIHAFRRGLDEGGDRRDHLYWLGWAFLWNGQRPLAEQAWEAFGAHDDSTERVFSLRLARGALEDRDSLGARRALAEAIRFGIGRPEAHAVLGDLLRAKNAKYALLETKVAVRLKPDDWLARRELVAALVAARLDDGARTELAELRRTHPEWARDTLAARLERTLRQRDPGMKDIARFPRTLAVVPGPSTRGVPR